MKRSEDLPLERHHVNFYAGDFGKLQSWYGTRLGASKIIRDIVHAHVRKIEEEAQQKTPLIGDIGVDIGGEAHDGS